MKKLFYSTAGLIFALILGCNVMNVSAKDYQNVFVQQGENWSYYDNNGDRVSNAWIYADGTYFVDENGNVTYGKKVIDGKEYVFDGTGKLTNDWLTFDGTKYVMASGTPIKNKQFILGNRHYCYDDNGDVITGLQNINGTLYYLTLNGANQEGFQLIDGAWRYVYRDGRVASDEFIALKDGKHYVDHQGKAKYGFTMINGDGYYFNNSGVMQTGIHYLNNGWKIFKNDGKMAMNQFVKFKGSTYFVNEKGNIVYGLKKINGKSYYFNNTGVMQSGVLLVNGAWRYFGSDGAMKSGEWFKIGKDTYYAQPSGSLTYGTANIDGDIYTFDSTGKLNLRGGLVTDEKGTRYIENGIVVKNAFRDINGNRYYFNSQGYRHSGLLYLDHNFYYFDQNGIMQHDAFIESDGWRYFNKNGKMVRSTWIRRQDGTYWADKYGLIVYGWNEIGGKQYFFDKYGKLKNLYYGVDISEHNGVINWAALKAIDISFAVIRASFGDTIGGRPDYRFEQNLYDAYKNGMKIGVYHYSYSTTVADARNEAKHILSILNGRYIDMPIYFDIEDKCQSNLSKSQITAIIDAFCTTIEEGGYRAGVYANLNWLNNKIDTWVLQGRDVWVAQWNDHCDYQGDYTMWQYTSNAIIDGKRFDMNIWYR